MKIENNGIKRLNPSETEAAHPADKTSRSSESGQLAGLSGKDNATLSDRARALAKAYTALEEIPEVRSEKVDELKEQIQTGNYQVPVEGIVKRLLANVRMS